ncbi:response regulator [Paenibacillus sinopodophylli]|uniref:response regulator n=1 Tax=Paenibacillus sinopodophylli TaxID=1837342 RepID=UPI00110CB9C0|nr:response regulator [Paenibacillus sinopodophylli]
MLKAILIDDEEPALVHLERLLKADGRVQIAGMYTSAQEGLDHLAQNDADVAFLDIGMPEMNGLQAAERIQSLYPHIRIIYVTAYSAYAVEAFELYALDYLLKPVDASRIGKTLNRIEEYAKLTSKQPLVVVSEPSGNELSVRLFKRLELRGGGGLNGKVKWRTKKAQELFAYLLHLEGTWVTKDRLIETLWREQEQDKAITYLHHSVSRIRWLLREWGVSITVEYEDESYRLTSTGIRTDVAEFEEALTDFPHNARANWSRYDYAASLYAGEYLEDHNYDWAETRRTNLQQRYFQLVCSMARHELQEGRERSAIQRLLNAQAGFPYSDELCRLLMTGYSRLKDVAALNNCYTAFELLLFSELGVIPERQTTDLYKQLL